MTRPIHRHNIGIQRRELIQVGFSGLLAAAMPRLAHADRPGAVVKSPRKVLIVFLTGGPSHLDMFDLKPDAPEEIRGPFKPIATSVDGIQISEHLPMLAARMGHLAMVRSMTHRNNGHLPATHHLLTGTAIPGIPEDLGVDKIASRTDWPCYSAGLEFLQPRTNGVPHGVALPTYLVEGPLTWPGQNAGCLGSRFDPWQINSDPNRKDFRVENLRMPDGFTAERLQQRKALLQQVNRTQDRLAALAETRSLSDQQQLAFSVITSGKVGQAFDLDREPATARDTYGRHMFGQSLLLGRRLLESGVSIVQANMGIVQTWDSHVNNWERLKNELLPPLDRAVSALLDDLSQRGMLDETLVVITGEFGRQPKITTLAGQTLPGRDHWAQCFTSLFAGGGVRGGQVIGASDATGSYPASDAWTASDLGATVYHALGVPPNTEVIDREGRPIPLNKGQVIRPLYGSA